MYSPLLINLRIKPEMTIKELRRKDSVIVTSNPSRPSHAPVIAKSLASPAPNAGFLIISFTIKLIKVIPNIAIK